MRGLIAVSQAPPSHSKMSKLESPSSRARKLKQAQLPFAVIQRTSPATTSTQKKNSLGQGQQPEGKENVCSLSKRRQEAVEGNPKKLAESREVEPMLVDLTEDDANHEEGLKVGEKGAPSGKLPFSTIENIENTIDSVVRRYSSDFKAQNDREMLVKENLSAKKRRRRSRSLSPVPPHAKRAVLSSTNEQNFSLEEPVDASERPEISTDKNPPKVIVTAPTPVKSQSGVLKINDENAKKHLKKFFEGILKYNEKETCDAVTKTSPDSSHVKQGSKYPPLSCILAKKRPRSKSPIGPRKQSDVSQDKKQMTSSSSTVVNKKENSANFVAKQGEMDSEMADTRAAAVAGNKSATILATFLKSPKQEGSSKSEKPKLRPTSPVKEEPEFITIVDVEEERSKEMLGSPPKTVQSTQEIVTPPAQKSSKTAKDSPPNSGAKGRRSLEAQRKKEEKEKEKEDKRKQREEQRLAKEKEKLELKRKMEEKKALKEEERRKKKEEEEAAKAERQKKLEEKKIEKEKLETEKKLEKERKEEERRKEKEKKEEEKRQKELAKQKIEKEKIQADEEKRRKNEKRAETFKSFFKSPTRSPSVKKIVESAGVFAPFQPKQDMVLAPLHRHKITSVEKLSLDELMQKQDYTSFYLQGVSSRPRVCSGPTMPRLRRKLVSLAEDGLELIDDDSDSKPGAKILRAKFLLFHTNHRPPYYGTWRKESKVLSCKNPFRKDNDLFDYEFDSDDEWEEPVEGEDIANSDEEGDEADGNEEDDDDGFFVPHGYLSDDEGINEDADEDNLKPDHKLKQKQLEFEASFKRKLSTLTPIVIGCVWKDTAESLDKVHRDILNNYKPEFLSPVPIEISPRSNSPANDSENLTDCLKSDQRKSHSSLKAVPEEAMSDLIRLLHGNALSLSRIVIEFRAYWTIKKSSTEPLTVGPAPLDEISPEDDAQPMDTSQEPLHISPTITEPASEMLQAKDDATKTIVSTPKGGDKSSEISKTQLLKKCKEIATYTKRENMNRACWFVHDHVLEQFEMDKEKAPVPCRWNYATEVPKMQILIFPQAQPKPAPIPEPVIAPPKQSPGASIAKFVAKVSPNVILEQSKLKYNKEKQTAVAAPSISKYTTEKISPSAIIQKSAQKIEEELIKAKQVQELETLKSVATSTSNQQQAQEGTYVIPTPDAVRSFFRIEATDSIDLTSQD